MEKEPEDSLSENFCYECGSDIPADKHFCDSQCAENFANRYGRENVVNTLRKQTKLRKIFALPHYKISWDEAFFRYGRVSNKFSPKVQQELTEFIKKLNDTYTYKNRWLKDLTKEAESSD